MTIIMKHSPSAINYNSNIPSSTLTKWIETTERKLVKHLEIFEAILYLEPQSGDGSSGLNYLLRKKKS